jgi:lactoylglutathione lyase
MPAKLNNSIIEIGIMVRDAEKQLAFYRDVLGLEYLGDLVFPGAHMWRFDGGGGSVIKLLEMDPMPEAENPRGDATGMRFLSLYVGNIDELVPEMIAGGGTVVIPVTEFQPGARFAFVEDPEGNRLEILDVDLTRMAAAE